MMSTVIKKELRGYFNSAIAVIFLAVFLAAVLGTFFWWEKFFARGLADLRPLFKWMPMLLIIVVSALSMRMWSDERRDGTLEVLLTLPVPRWQLVVGKFLAGMVLIGVALGLTLGLPITIAQMGNLDFGPVAGGYFAALLLSAAYLSIGMCISAATNNQIVAFIGTAAVCAATYAVGELPDGYGRLFGTGTRFESVARGVLDLRDLAYYAGIVATGIAINVLLLQRISWSTGARGYQRRLAALLGVGLVIGNAIALDLWLAPVRRARIDLTQNGSFSLSPATRQILAGLDEQLVIHGFFSGKTHPKLAQLTPQLRDMLEEYKIAGGSKVRVRVDDPSDDDDAKGVAKDRYGIDPTPIPVVTDNEQTVINSYFAIAIEYGDQHEVLGFDDLVSFRRLDIGDIELTAKNPEYQITKAIKKTVAAFGSVESMFASTPGKIQLTAYVSTELPEELKTAPEALKKIAEELKKQSNGKLEFSTVAPTTDAQRRELLTKYGIRGYPDLTGAVTYFHLVLQIGDRLVRIIPQRFTETDLRTTIVDGLKRAAPGFTRVVGLWQPPPPDPLSMPGAPPRQMPPPQSFRALQNALSGNYEVRDIELNAPIPDDVEALVLAGPASLDAKAAEHVDQFVMRGGAVVALAGRYRFAPTAGLGVEKVTTGLEAAFQKWGITVEDDMVLDTKNEPLPIPEERQLPNGLVVREIRSLPYPYFVKLDGRDLSSNPITSGLAGSVMHWVSPIKTEAKVGEDEHRVEPLMTSAESAWRTPSTAVEPDLVKFPELGFADAAAVAADKKGSQVVAVAVVGAFASSLPPEPPAAAGSGSGGVVDMKTRRIDHSPPDTRLVVFGSSTFVSDLVVEQLNSVLTKSNLELVHNAVDWALADTDLLGIRSHNEAARVLTIPADSRGLWRNVNIAIALIGLVTVVGFGWLRRRGVQPILTSTSQPGGSAGSTGKVS